MRLEKMPKKNSTINYTITNFKNLLLLLVAGFLSAQQTPQELVTRMGRGLNLGNVLSAPVEGNWAGEATEQYFIDVPDGTSDIQFQLLCGQDVGTYYFDNFSVTGETLSLKKRSQNIATYPNPVSNKLYIQKDVSVGTVSLYDINGKNIKSWETQKNKYDLSFLKNGIYFIEIVTENNLLCTKSIIKR